MFTRDEQTMNHLLLVPLFSCVILLVYLAWRILNSVWLTPKRLEKLLRAQGLRGNSYKFLYGDFKELVSMMEESLSKPISLSDDIAPRVLAFLIKTINKYGKSCFVWLGPVPAVIILDPEHVKQIFHKTALYGKNRFHPLGKYLLQGLVDAEGDKWSKHRKLINPAFHQEKLKQMVPAFHLCASHMLSKWEESISQNDGSCERDVWTDLKVLASDALSRTVFGTSNYEEGRRIFELQTEQTDLVMTAVKSFYFPGSRFLPTKRLRRIREIEREILTIVGGMVDKRVKAMKAGEPTNDDLLNVLLKSNLSEIEIQGDQSFGMSIEEVMQECKLFYFAGHETTSTLLVWTLVLLSKHQDWQSRAREEVLRVFGSNEPNFEGLNHLKIVRVNFSMHFYFCFFFL
ncbi:OLC1v1021233C2 [Oldenlandia corymbosa var. corymbosa]|uniref:OLC1v1021233C2 n=1 Tax=Oldenlandia corymbosa var. corymbosa TaxID=529605 RepID=A0AAV1BV81_OLDCO|nr:OLC1v1021233C2 [Oldenlandia corymbosa var. corymbosa]